MGCGKHGASFAEPPRARCIRTDRQTDGSPCTAQREAAEACTRARGPGPSESRSPGARPGPGTRPPCSPAPPVRRHQPLPVQSGRRPPARRRHRQLPRGCTRTTHKANKRQAAAPAPLGITDLRSQPPALRAPAHGPAPPRTPAGPAPRGGARKRKLLAQPNGQRGGPGRNGKGRGGGRGFST